MKGLLHPLTHYSGRTLAALGLTLAALTLGSGPMSTVHAAERPTLTATVHDNWGGDIARIPYQYRYLVTRQPHYTLHITGSHFRPGARVTFALVRDDTLQVLKRGMTYAEPARILAAPKLPNIDTPDLPRWAPNPQAGTVDYHARIDSVPLHASLSLLSGSMRQVRYDHVARD